jgi:feruloyl esterase
MEIQRFPDDYDGYVVGAPWNFQSHSNAGFVWNAQAINAAPIPAAKLPAITAAVLAACDANDGLVDGVISDPTRCRFDPRVLLCSGAETNSCLTSAQLGTLEKIYQGPRNPRTGQEIFPGFMRGGEAGWAGIVGNSNVAASGLATGYFANITFQSRTWDYRTFDFDQDMAYADLHVGLLGNAIDPDLSEAKKRGIKIIQYHGWNDQTLQPEYSPEYYESVARHMGGLHKLRSFYRLFMVPGMTHCYFGPGATSFGAVGQQIPPARDEVHDIQTALETWVEKGEPPNRMVATKYTDDAAATRTIRLQRPLCAYPSSPQYKGSGDPNDARNFVCKTPKGRVLDD